MAAHPLESKWVFWYDNPKMKKPEESWEENLKRINAFDNVEDFWCLFNNMAAPKKLSLGSNYHLFKEGIKPMWEDPENKLGGKWVLTVPKGRNRSLVDQWWMNMILLMIGENMADDGDINGVVVSLRKSQDRIALWTKSAQKEDLQLKIGTQFRKGLEIPPTFQLKYQAHADAEASGSSFQNKAFYEA